MLGSLQPSEGSFWGGVVVNVTGTGFVPTDPAQAAGRRMDITLAGYYSGGYYNLLYKATVLFANTTFMRVHIGRWFDSNVTPPGRSTSLGLQVSVWDNVSAG